MDILNRFGWGGNAANEGQTPNWEEFSDAVKMNVIRFLDKESLTNLAEAIPSARRIVESNCGIKLVIPLRNWDFVGGALSMFSPFKKSLHISDNFIAKLVSEAEGKKIRDLEMTEMPGACKTFVFDKFLAYPGNLKHVKLKYCDVQLIHELLTKCNNLVSFHYLTGLYRQFPSGPLGMILTQAKFGPGSIPAYGGNFLSKIDRFAAAFQLNSLKEISITMDYMLATFYTDWHNVIYILLRLPALPSVTKFNFQFSPKSIWLSWKTHLLILACLADFLAKVPNLTHFQYHSNFNVVDPMHDIFLLDNWRMEMLSGLITRYGSNHLRQMNATASNGPGVIVAFQDSLRQTMNLAAGSLQRLESLDLKLGETKEHRVFSDFILHLPARVTNVRVTDLSNATHEPDMRRDNVYKVFVFPLQNPRPMFASITILKVKCTKALIQRTSLTLILESSPQLTEVEFEGPTHDAACYLDLEDRAANPGIFRRLERLVVKNICLACQVPQAGRPRQSSVLCRFKNLRELSVESSVVVHGILVIDVLEIIASLRKLSKVHVKPMLFYPFTGQRQQNGRGLDILGRIGHVMECGPEVTDTDGRLARVYDFVLKEFELLTI